MAADQLGLEMALTPPSPTRMITRHNVDADGHPIALWEKSPSEARGAIVLLHGRTWSARPNYDLQVPGEDLSLMDSLVESGYAAFAIDFRGYGETPRSWSMWGTSLKVGRDLRFSVGPAARRWLSSLSNAGRTWFRPSFFSAIPRHSLEPHWRMAKGIHRRLRPRTARPPRRAISSRPDRSAGSQSTRM